MQCCINQNNDKSKETRISQRDPKNRIELKFISNKNNLSIYNKSLLMAGYINMCMETYSIWFQIRNDCVDCNNQRSLSKTWC